MTECTLNRSWGALSSGTRMTVINDSNVPWEKKGDVNSSGYVTVRLTSPASYKLLEQTRIPSTFDIEKEYLTPVRSRVVMAPVKNRKERRRGQADSRESTVSTN